MTNESQTTMYEACLLHAKADRALRTVVAEELERYKVTMMEWLLLGVVCGGPEKGLSMSSVANSLDVTLPQVTALVSNLVDLKLVKQKTQAHDRRSRHVVPTVKGKSLLTGIEEGIGVTMRQWLADVPRDNLRVYFETVKTLATRQQ